MARSSLTFLVLALGALLTQSLGAQVIGTGITTQASLGCDKEQKLPGTASSFLACEQATVDGSFVSTLAAVGNGVRQASVAVLANGTPVSGFADVFYGDAATVRGPLALIFSAAVRVYATVGSNFDALPEAGDVEFAAWSPFGDSYSGSSDDVRSLYQPSYSRTLQVNIWGFAIQQSGVIFLDVETMARASAPFLSSTAAYGFAQAQDPTISFYDAQGLDITDQFSLTYASVTATPEPTTLLLVGSGLGTLGGFVRRRRTRTSASA